MKDRAPDCLKCKHFYITWDNQFPRGCRVFSFKTPNWPSQDIYRNTGHHCPSFEASPKHKNSIE